MGSIHREAKRDTIVNKRPSRLAIVVRSLQRLLRLARISEGAFVLLTLLCLIGGFIAGVLLFEDNSFGIMVALGMMPLPMLLVLVRSRGNSQLESEELEGMMSNITHAYLGTGNIISAFETYSRMRNEGLDSRLRRIGPIEEFIVDVHSIDPGVENALRKLQAKINNRFFDDWINMLVLCQRNRELRFALQPIIKAFNDAKIMQIEAETALKRVWGEFFTLVGLVLGFTACLRWLYEVWFNILIYTMTGRVLFALLIATVIGSSFYMLRVTRPLE